MNEFKKLYYVYVYIHTHNGVLSAIIKGLLLSLSIAWIKLESIISSKVNQDGKYEVLSQICETINSSKEIVLNNNRSFIEKAENNLELRREKNDQ